MKTHILILILASIVFNSCRDKKSQPFNTSLLEAIFEARDSLENNNKVDSLISIEFYSPDRYERRCIMKIFSSNRYSSSTLDAYTKIGNLTVAIYNLKDDLYGTVNKNDITFFSDTIKGYKDVFMLSTNKKYFYSIYKSDSIKRTKYSFDDFPVFQPLRKPRYGVGATFTVPKLDWFRLDSLRAEKEVEFYRNRGKKHN